MFKIFRLLFISGLIFFIGCEDKVEEELNPIIGIYELVSISVTIESNPSQTQTLNSDGSSTYETMILGEDGSYSYSGKNDGDFVSGGGTWSTTGNKLTVVDDGETQIWDYTLNDNGILTCTSSVPETQTEYGYSIVYTWDKED